MTLTTKAKVRISIRIQDTDVLSDAAIDQAIADAVNQINVTDELAERFLTCWILADDISWDKVKSTGGTTFEIPSPERFENKYLMRLKQLGAGRPKKVNWKVSDTTEP